MSTPACHLCGYHPRMLFSVRVLNCYDVMYYQCCSCRLVQTEHRFLHEDPDHNPVEEPDTFRSERSIYDATLVESLLALLRFEQPQVLDNGAAYSMLDRLHRKASSNVLWNERAAPILSAKGYQWVCTPVDLLARFHVANQFDHPVEKFEKLFTDGDTVFLSTTLISDRPKSPVEGTFFARRRKARIAQLTQYTSGDRATVRATALEHWSYSTPVQQPTNCCPRTFHTSSMAQL